MGWLRGLLRGGGARARKHARRMPRTVADMRRAYAAVSRTLPYPRGDIEDASWQKPSGHVVKYKAKILPDTIVAGKTCVYFVTEAQGNDLSYSLRDKPYEVTKLCSGGRAITGMTSTDNRAGAARAAAAKAYYETHGRYPPLHGARRR